MKGNIFIKRPVMAISISILDFGDRTNFALYTCRSSNILTLRRLRSRVEATYTGVGCQCGDEQCYHATGRKHQWCGKHDVHDFNSNQCRFGNDRGIFQTRDKPRYGSRQRTESCNEGTGFIAC